jgi:asparagine synthase (glutamine-hydrolysing)
MCAIAGLLDTARRLGPARLRAAATAMAEAMAHRGPDDAGVWVDPTGVCALAHRRLAVVDLSAAGRQPMVHPSGRSAIVLNGEIYNHRELAGDLVSQGVELRSRSDAEVLLHLMADQRAAPLAALRGMYAFAVWNADRGELLLASDPFGKKPLYVAQQGGLLAFASELSALARLAELDLAISADAVGQYLLLGYIPAPRSIYRDVEKLAPGHYARVRTAGGALAQVRYWSFAAGSPQPSVRLGDSPDARVRQLGAALERAVARRLAADVPVGAFLSGGVDSSLVVALARRLGHRLPTFSLGFADTAESEHLAARDVARHLGTEHHEIVLATEATALAPVVAAALDEPNGDSSCLPTHALAEFARREVTVVLSGDGGDELFGGYDRYGDMLARGADVSGARYTPRVTVMGASEIRALMGEIPGAVADTLARIGAAVETDDRPLLHRLRNLDVELYLPGSILAKVDRMSMRWALEVRSPFLDVDVAAIAAALPAADCTGKALLRDLLREFLPAAWVERPKRGFGLPETFWRPSAVVAWARDLMEGSTARLTGHVDRAALRRWLATQDDPQQFALHRLWPLLLLELWLRAHPRG